MIRKLAYWTLMLPLILIGAVTSAMAWLDEQLFNSMLLEKYKKWCIKITGVKY